MKVGEEFVEITGDGRRTTSKVTDFKSCISIRIILMIVLTMMMITDQVTVDGSTMVHVQKGDSARGEKDTKIVRSAKNRPGKISQLRKYRQERRL